MRLTDQLTLYFNYNLSTVAVFLNVEEAFYTTWYPGLLYKLLKLNLKTTKWFLASVKQQYIILFCLMATCFGHLTIIRLSLQNLE